MNVISRKLSKKFKDIGVNQKSLMYHVYNKSGIPKLCIKTEYDNYLIVRNKSKGKILYKSNIKEIYSAFDLSEINNMLKYYSRYFIVNYDVDHNHWKIDKSIFKIFFLNIYKRKNIGEAVDLIERDFSSEVEAKGELLYFLCFTEFLDVNDLNI